MEEVTSFLIVFDNPSTVYFSGMDVSGKVLLTLSQNLEIKEINFEAHGFAHVQWNEEETEADHVKKSASYESHEDYFSYKHKLFGGEETDNEKHMLTSGHYEFFFRYQLPSHLPASFEGNCGHVRYYCQTTIERPWKFDFKTKHPFTISCVMDLNNMPIAKNYVDISKQQTVSCTSCISGPVSVRAQIPRMGYSPGEPIPLVVEINNRNRHSIKNTKASLIQIATYHASGKSRTEKSPILEVNSGSIKARSSYTWDNGEIIIPAIPPSNLEGCHIIDIVYHIDLFLESSRKPIDISIQLPIIIATIPLRELWSKITSNNLTPLAPKIPVPYPDLPPPMFGAYVFGATNIKEANDNEYVRGQLNYTPLYPVYKIDPDCK